MSKPRMNPIFTGWVPIALFVLVGAFTLGIINYSVQMGAGSQMSKASRDTFLTPGDDGLSLQQDPNSLGTDPAADDDKLLDSFR